MSVDQNKAIVRRFLDEAWNQSNPLIADEVISPGYVLHGSSQSPGPEGVKQLMAAFRAAFTEIQSEFEDVFGEGDRVAVRWSTRAVHCGDFMGIEPSGQAVNYSGIDIFRLEKGQIVERWSSSDNLGMLQQLGAV